MSATRFKSKFGGFWWLDDGGYMYKPRKVYKSGWVYLVCVNGDCPGKSKVKCFENDSNRGECKNIHSHLPETSCVKENSVTVGTLRDKILQRAKTENTPNSIIFQQEINRAPIEIRNKLNFKAMERSMQRAHKSSNPGPVKTFEDFERLIMQWEERYGKVNGEKFFLGRFGEGSDENLIAIVSPLAEVLQHSDEWHLDGTFKCRPKEPKSAQLFVVMASEHGRAFPVAWALMKSRTTSAYNIVFKALKEEMPEMAPKIIISDYEKAIHASVKDNFPNTKHSGCWFHFSQAIERNSKKLGLKHGEEGGCDVSKRLMATALLPHDRIPDALKVIEEAVESTTAAYRAKAMKLIVYFKGEWMGKVTPQGFSVYGQKNRTNNCQETLNRNINRSIKPQGNTWDFWGGLIEISVKEINYFSQLSTGNECSRNKKNKWLLQDANIAKLQQKLVNGESSLVAFLSAASHRITAITSTPSAVDDASEDVEDVEIHSLDVLQDSGESSYSEAVDDNCSREPMETERQSLYVNYRWVPTENNPNDYMEITDIYQQRLELERGLVSSSDEVCELAEAGQPNCKVCLVMQSSRVCIPCGHNALCKQCVEGYVKQERYESVTGANGDIIEVDIRLPITCPVCRSIIGQIIRYYG